MANGIIGASLVYIALAFAAPAVTWAQTPGEPDPALPAATEPETSTATEPEAPAATEPVAPAATAPEATAPEKSEPVENTADERRFLLAVGGTLGLTLSDGEADVPFGGATLRFAADVGYGLEVAASLGYRYLRPAYVFRGAVVQGAIAFAEASPLEHEIDSRLELTYNTLEEVTDLLWLRVGVAPRYVQLLADGFDTWLFAPEAVLGIGADLGERIAVEGRFGFSAAVAGPDKTPSVDGLPVYVWDVEAGAIVDLTADGRVALELRYEGTVLVFEYAERIYHGAHGGLRVAF
ncbi:MAG: hypothetical protein EP329_26795 [Deltaproteobacteria bacterium]|nr:MAG: hypothetical protein EP329_26795 [Deltaproteobacteria bacterium]